MIQPEHTTDNLYRILTLDGGGAKGFYTLGVLEEIEAILGIPIYQRFDLIFGTSTGSIIAALLSMGKSVGEIKDFYEKNVPKILSPWLPHSKSKKLKAVADEVFQNTKFEDVKTGLGIVAVNWDFEKPIIFKNNLDRVHGLHSTFVPGFGCSISEAVQASCSAYPIFNMKTLTGANGRTLKLVDGGFCANNPTMYAIADAIQGIGVAKANLRVISIGVGVYSEPVKVGIPWLLRNWPGVPLLLKTLNVNTVSMEKLQGILFKDIPTIRINENFPQPTFATDLLETDLSKLAKINQLGRESFANNESKVRDFLL